jgi:hypothetical protein
MGDRFYVSSSAIEAWDWPGMPNTRDLPGVCLALQASQYSDSVWALCAIERRWWEFWQPKVRERWVNVPLSR